MDMASHLNSMDVIVDEVIDLVADVTGFTSIEIKSNWRKREVVLARFIVIYLVREMYGNSVTLGTIGKCLGGRDHSTIIHAINTLEDLIECGDKITLRMLSLCLEKHKENNFIIPAKLDPYMMSHLNLQACV